MDETRVMAQLHALNESEMFYRNYHLARFSPSGFEAFLPMLERWQPKALVHGHVHLRYGIPREQRCRNTRVINACGHTELEIDVDRPPFTDPCIR